MNNQNNRITCLEDFSNELFYDIFEYLHADLLYEAFRNLNSRFQNLLFGSPFLIKIQPDYSSRSQLVHYCKNFWIPNRHRILSIYFDHYSLIDISLAHCLIDSSFDRLKSVCFNELNAEEFIMLLFYLKSLPRLSSLAAILLNTGMGGLGSIYRMIFSLPALKCNQLTLESDDLEKDLNVSLPFAMNEPLSTIKYLTIDHNCTIQQLFSIINHTPKLRHLICKNLIGSGTVHEQPVAIPNLKYLTIECGFMRRIEFESVVKTLSAHVEILDIQHDSGEDYFDADRWKRMIQNHIPHWKKFDYKYRTFDDSEELEDVLHLKMNQFTSRFWTEKRWFFEAEISTDTIMYSISSHKKRWFDHRAQENISNSSAERIADIQLSIHQILPAIDQAFIDKYTTVFVAVPFIHLNIHYLTISEEMLLKIMHQLPNLVSLKISSLQVHPPGSPSSTKNKITKVYHKNTTAMEQLYFLLNHCSRMEHFQIDLSPTIDLNSVIRHIFRKDSTCAPELRSVCLCVPNASEITTHQIQNCIESENLVSNYMIKRCGDYIHLHWN